uniref:Uncharacterized protein n=1 Tax=Panagrolaimus sp. ES5 TaxID=591445 RepID=A0AC34GAT5_9BILA
MSKKLGTLTLLAVHPASPVLLTKNGPLSTIIFNAHVENISFPRPLIVRFTEYNYCKLVEAILRETSEGTSY